MNPTLKTDLITVNEGDLFTHIYISETKIDMANSNKHNFIACSFRDVEIVNMKSEVLDDHFEQCAFYDVSFDRKVVHNIDGFNVIARK